MEMKSRHWQCSSDTNLFKLSAAVILVYHMAHRSMLRRTVPPQSTQKFTVLCICRLLCKLRHTCCPTGLMVKAFASRAEDSGFDSCLRHGDFSNWSPTIDLKIGIPVATLPGTWWYRVSIWTGWSRVNILWLGEVESLICNLYLRVAACKTVWADPSLRYTSLLLGRLASNKQKDTVVQLATRQNFHTTVILFVGWLYDILTTSPWDVSLEN